MDKGVFQNKFDQAVYNNRALRFFASMLIISNFAVIGYIAYTATNTRTIIIPPNITRPLELRGNQLSAAYIREMVQYVLSLGLSYTPGNIENNYVMLLDMVPADVYENRKKEFYEYLKIIRESGTTSLFAPTTIVLDEANGRIDVTGERKLWNRDNRALQNVVEKWRVAYRVENGRMWILNLEKVDEK